jgi:NAD(P)-dependent dehydrogenase (short-subunit alcohol dehydrogenase family)
MESHDRNVVVTGATGGIGQAIVRTLASSGASVIGLDRTPDQESVFTESLAGFGAGRHLYLAADVSSSEEVEAVFRRIKEEVGTVDALINCAGVREIASSLDLSAADFQDIVRINLGGTFHTSQSAANLVLVDGGAIVNIASVAGLLGIGSRPAYTASKHAIVGLSRCLARDLAFRGIRVNVVCPGIIRSPLTESYFSDEKFIAELPIFIPLGEAGTPQDVADAVLFLASPRAKYITGVALPVDGGWSAEKGFAIPSDSSAYLASVIPT